MRLTSLLLALAAFTVSAFGAGCQKESSSAAPPAAQQPPPAFQGTIVAMGDSLTAGYGVPETDAYPAQLEKKLHQAGYPWKVVNAGISGETSAGALSRVDWVLRLNPDIVILETGANDGLRGIDPKVTRSNIEQTVKQLKGKNVVVMLAGMRMFANLGGTFTRDFAKIYPDVASREKLILMPFFLEGVAGKPVLNQSDGIHPVAEGYRIVTDKVYPFVLKAIEQRKKEGHG